MKSKNKVLTVFSIICFIVAIIEILIGCVIGFTDLGDGIIESAGIEKISALETIEYMVVKLAFVFIYFIEAMFFVVESWLINRASKNGKKTVLLIFLLLMGIFFQLLTLISAAVRSAYDINSAIDVLSVLIKVYILKQVFEVRRLDMDY